MQRDDFKQLFNKCPVLLDGALKAGSAPDECTETWMLKHFDTVTAQLYAFKEAGSTIIRSPTSGANRFRLETYGLASDTVSINRELIRRTCESVGGVKVFGTCSTIGIPIEPFGELDFDAAVISYTEQGRALEAGGAEGFFIEEIADIQEARAAIIGLRSCTELPIIVCLQMSIEGFIAQGTNPLSALITLQSLGADAVGIGTNSSNAIETISSIIKQIKPFATVPLLALPPATGVTPELFGSSAQVLIRSGAQLLGGGKDTYPEHIAALRKKSCNTNVIPPVISAISAVSSVRSSAIVGKDHPFAIVGERINPTGKKKLQANLRKGSLEMVEQYALEQQQRSATILDINMGLSGIDEMKMMLQSIRLLSILSPLPLCIDTTKPDVVEAALRRYPGRALLNSVSGEKDRIERTLPVAARYGAMIIVLPLTDSGIPETVKKRISIVETVLAEAQSYGITVKDIVVDGLVMTISSNSRAAIDTLDLIEWSSESLQSNTILGLSNVSFGMPQRQWINGAFLGMAMGRGLTMAIANPSSDGIMATVQAYNSLMGHKMDMLLHSGAFRGEE